MKINSNNSRFSAYITESGPRVLGQVNYGTLTIEKISAQTRKFYKYKIITSNGDQDRFKEVTEGISLLSDKEGNHLLRQLKKAQAEKFSWSDLFDFIDQAKFDCSSAEQQRIFRINQKKEYIDKLETYVSYAKEKVAPCSNDQDFQKYCMSVYRTHPKETENQELLTSEQKIFSEKKKQAKKLQTFIEKNFMPKVEDFPSTLRMESIFALSIQYICCDKEHPAHTTVVEMLKTKNPIKSGLNPFRIYHKKPWYQKYWNKLFFKKKPLLPTVSECIDYIKFNKQDDHIPDLVLHYAGVIDLVKTAQANFDQAKKEFEVFDLTEKVKKQIA